LRELLQTADKLNPKHKLGASLLNSYELAGNREMGQRAQGRATVHPHEPGLQEGYNGRKGRKGRSK
jgi:hypothetical protein